MRRTGFIFACGATIFSVGVCAAWIAGCGDSVGSEFRRSTAATKAAS